jgi:hypothetical protein
VQTWFGEIAVFIVYIVKTYCGRIAVFIFNIVNTHGWWSSFFYIFARLIGQLRAPAALSTGKYSPLVLAFEGQLIAATAVVWMFSLRVKYLAFAKD